MKALVEVPRPQKRDTQMYCVIVDSAVGDSDFIPFETLNQASDAYRAFCEENGLGARDAGRCEIWHGNKVVAHVAFNGNVFAGCYPHKHDDLLFNRTGLVWRNNRWDIPCES